MIFISRGKAVPFLLFTENLMFSIGLQFFKKDQLSEDHSPQYTSTLVLGFGFSKFSFLGQGVFFSLK